MKYASLLVLCGLCTAALGQHAGDIVLAVEAGRLVTGGVADDQTITTPATVFGAQFGDSGCPAFTSNPGFDSLPGTFAADTKLGWNALSGWRSWTGDGFEPAVGEFLNVSFVSLAFDVGDGPAEGFDLFVQPNGAFHVHLDFCMNDCPDGCTPPADADPGVYLLELEMYSTDPAVAPSDPFWIVFNYLDSAENVEAASDWVIDHLAGGSSCGADVTGDGVVDVSDLVAVVVAWGACGSCVEDVNGDGLVDVSDLLEAILGWGACE